jgi:hypothetical protein
MWKPGFQFLLAACLLTGTLWAATDPLAGEWKLEPSRSNLTGNWKLDPSKSKATDLMRVAKAGPNKYTLIFNSGGFETVGADGTDQPALFGTTLSITAAGPDNWKVVRKKAGQTITTGNWKLSEDGKTLTDAFTSKQPDGSTSTVNYIYIRTAGVSGFPGSWESQSEKVNSSFEFQIRPYEGDGLSLINPGEGSTKSMKLDGKDYAAQGKYVAPGSVSSGRRINQRTLEVTDKIKGRIADTQQIKLSPDLETLTIIIHPSGQSKPNIFVFDREA